jgi:hypothetical protein
LSTGFKDSLTITSDCNYSGWWPKQIEQSWGKDYKGKFTALMIQSTCKETGTIEWDVFRKIHMDGDQ